MDGNFKKDFLKLLWNIEFGDMLWKELVCGSCGIVWLVIWRGGLFVRKDCVRRFFINNCCNIEFLMDVIEKEFNVVELLFNEYIVYCFGVFYVVNKSFIFMEYMFYNLY